MSLNPSINLKLQLGSDLRKVSKAPRSLSELHSLLSVLYNRQDFLLAYQDEEGDLISITSEQDLQSMYERAQDKPSVKIILRETEENRSEQGKSEENVFERIENLKQSLMQSVCGERMSQAEVLEEPRMQSFISSDSVNRYQEFSDLVEVPDMTGSRASETPASLDFTQPSEINCEPEKKEKRQQKEKKDKKENKERKEKNEKKEKKEKKPKQEKKSKETRERKEELKEGINESEVVVHQYIHCDGCGMNPLCGIRYKCTICHDYDLCERCEDSLNHPHPLIKLRVPMKTGANAIWGNSGPPSHHGGHRFGHIKEIVTAKIKEMMKKKYKVKVCQCLHSKQTNVFPGTEVQFEWELMNKGRMAWPEGSRLVRAKGDFTAKDVNLPTVEPGQKVTVRVSALAPNIEKECSGVWKVVVGEKEFGKIKGSAVVVADKNIKELVGMGFSVENAKIALDNHLGNMDLAISQLLRN